MYFRVYQAFGNSLLLLDFGRSIREFIESAGILVGSGITEAIEYDFDEYDFDRAYSWTIIVFSTLHPKSTGRRALD
jgi:hypothetical protein